MNQTIEATSLKNLTATAYYQLVLKKMARPSESDAPRTTFLVKMFNGVASEAELEMLSCKTTTDIEITRKLGELHDRVVGRFLLGYIDALEQRKQDAKKDPQGPASERLTQFVAAMDKNTKILYDFKELQCNGPTDRFDALAIALQIKGFAKSVAKDDIVKPLSQADLARLPPREIKEQQKKSLKRKKKR